MVWPLRGQYTKHNCQSCYFQECLWLTLQGRTSSSCGKIMSDADSATSPHDWLHTAKGSPVLLILGKCQQESVEPSSIVCTMAKQRISQWEYRVTQNTRFPSHLAGAILWGPAKETEWAPWKSEPWLSSLEPLEHFKQQAHRDPCDRCKLWLAFSLCHPSPHESARFRVWLHLLQPH